MEKKRKLLKRIMSLFLAAVMTLSVAFANFSEFSKKAYAAGTVTVRFHYPRTDGSFDSWYLWAWPKGEAGAWYGFTGKDSEGRGVATISGISGSVTSLGFIVTTKSWTKDYDDDRAIDLSDVTSGVVDVYLNQGKSNFSRVVSSSAYVLSNARVEGNNTLAIDWSSKQSQIPDVTVYDETTNTTRTDIVSKTFNGETGFYINFTNKLYVGHSYKITYGSGETVFASVDYDSDYFEKNLTYSGNDLGSTYTKSATTFKVWAPTADKLTLLLFDKGTIEEGSKCIGEYEMEGGTTTEHGVWSKKITGDQKNVYYIYKVEIAGKTNYCMDPYSVSGCTTNDSFAKYATASTPKNSLMTGQRSMVTDLDSTDPANWSKDKHVVTAKKTNASVYELSIRDFSNDPDSGISAANRMKYLAFTETGTTLRNEGKFATGIDYLANLGVKYIQIMPSYDFAGTDELTMANYNWGYNPVNYNVPEGSFSSNPKNGNVRVNEYKQMVQAIHSKGMGVIMDVVYNHVNSGENFCFEQLVPGYFLRGSNGSGCGNDVASERTMVRKYIVDSVKYWANEYHIDGFRFDLVGLLDTETMNQIRAALDEINPNMLIYGEGWSLSTAPVKSTDLATQANTNKMPGVGMFNDVIRSDLRGGNDSTTTGFASGNLAATTSLKKDIVADTWFTNDPNQIINYASCHDNYTLWDKLTKTTAWAWESSRIKMNNMVAAINITSQGIPLFLGGEEFLRTKQGEENSYNSPDTINYMDWSLIETNKQVVDYYAGLLKFRNNHEGLCIDSRATVDKSISYINTGECVIVYTIDGKVCGDVADKILVAINPYLEEKTISLPSGEWKICVNGEKAGTTVLGTATSSIKLTGYSVYVLVQGETEKPIVPIKTGWQTENGNTYYYDELGEVVTAWQQISNKWYYFNAEGIMQTGWQKISNKWYYFNAEGIMQKGWLKLSGKWYYLDNSGVMVTGWKKISNKWYYLEASGVMATGWKKISNKWYYLEASGVMVTGWKKIGNNWYHFDTSGVMEYSKWIGNYYLKASGIMAVSEWVDGGKYYVGADGLWIKGYK